MFESIYVCLSPEMLTHVLTVMTEEGRRKTAAQIDVDIRNHFEHTNRQPPDIVALVEKIASYYPDRAVASHYIAYGTLNVFVDLLPSTSHFVYTPHSLQAH